MRTDYLSAVLQCLRYRAACDRLTV